MEQMSRPPGMMDNQFRDMILLIKNTRQLGHFLSKLGLKREKTWLGLKDSKEFVERMRRNAQLRQSKRGRKLLARKARSTST